MRKNHADRLLADKMLAEKGWVFAPVKEIGVVGKWSLGDRSYVLNQDPMDGHYFYSQGSVNLFPAQLLARDAKGRL